MARDLDRFDNLRVYFDELPNYPAITEGKSTPCDPTAPSFLTTFPAEIRNAVYDALFHVYGGIRLSPSEDFITRSTFEDQDVRATLVAGLPLLSTCRQIYQEAATTLYSNNIWIVSRDLDQTEVKDGSVEHGTMTEATGAVVLLTDLGSRRVMVKKILLDVDRACPIPCETHEVHPFPPHWITPHLEPDHAVEMWSLVRAMAQLPHLTVEFVHPKRQAYYDFHPPNGASGTGLGVDLDGLNTALQTLKKDVINIGRYGQQISEVYIQRDCSAGIVVFQSSRRVPMYDRTRLGFNISDKGATFAWANLEREPHHLLGLPDYIQRQIVNEASSVGRADSCGSDSAIVWDVDRKISTGVSLICGAICDRLRNDFMTMLRWDRRHIIKTSTSELRSDFDDFRTLQESWSEHSYFNSPLGRPSDPYPVSLLLEFHVHPEVTLEDIKLNITKLLQLTADCKGRMKVTISINRGEGFPSSETTTNLYICRALALTALSEVGPGKWMVWEGFSQDKHHPPIWMNGHFEVVEVDLKDRKFHS